jgi:hypothetical protein
MTRVYVVAPQGSDFEVDFPELGEDLSGYESAGFFAEIPRIMDADAPAFAVDNAFGEYGRIWRATYRLSNSAEDIRISRVSGLLEESQTYLDDMRLKDIIRQITLPISLVVSLLIWVIAWRFVMKRYLGVEFGLRSGRSIVEAVGWAFLYPILNIAALLVVVFGSFIMGIGLILGIPLAIAAALGIVSIFFFSTIRAPKLQVTQKRAAIAYLLIVLLSNAIYIPLGLTFAALAGVL